MFYVSTPGVHLFIDTVDKQCFGSSHHSSSLMADEGHVDKTDEIGKNTKVVQCNEINVST